MASTTDGWTDVSRLDEANYRARRAILPRPATRQRARSVALSRCTGTTSLALAAVVSVLIACGGSQTLESPTLPTAPAASAAEPHESVTETVAPTVQTSVSPPPAGRLVFVEDVVLADDGASVTVTFSGAPHYPQGNVCSREYTAAIAELRGELQIGVFETGPPASANDDDIGCPDVGIERVLHLPLQKSFEGFRVRDLSGYLRFVRRPPDLPVIDMPEGWELASEDDIGHRPDGGWEQTYAPVSRRLTGDERAQVSFYVEFDGPPTVEGSRPEAPALVNGEPARVWSSETGEIVLGWSLRGDGLTLAGYTQHFSLTDLVEMAESARSPTG